MAMPNISDMVILSTLYNGSVLHSSDIKKKLVYHKQYLISDGLLSTTIKKLANKGYLEVTQNYSKSKKIIRMEICITAIGKEYYELLQQRYLDEVNRINRALSLTDYIPQPRNK